jgi:hypothetical protein
MAITNAQQYQQLVNKPANGKRPGYKGWGPGAGSPGTTKSGGNKNKSSSNNDKGGSDYGQFQRAVNRTKNNPTTTTPSGNNNDGVDVGFQEALRKQKIEKKKKEARDDGGFRTTGSQIYSPPTTFQKFKNDRIQNAINRNKYLALQKTSLIPGGGFKGFAGTLIDGLFGKVPENLQDLSEEELTELAFEVQKFKDAGGPVNQATYNYNLNPTKKGSGLELLGRTFDAQDILDSGKMTQTKFEELFPGPTLPKDDGGRDSNNQTDPCLGPNPPAYCAVNNNPTDPVDPRTNFYGLSPRIAGSMFDFSNLAEGGRVPAMDGGIMDLARQELFLGGIAKGLKKAVRGVKKIAKSPLGKVALLAAGAGYGGFGPLKGLFSGVKGAGFLKGAGMKNFFLKEGAEKFALSNLSGKGIASIIGGASILPLLMGPKEEDDFDIEAYYAANRLNPNAPLNTRIAGSQFAFADGGRIGYSDGMEAGAMSEKEMKKLAKSPLYKGFKKMYGIDPSMAKGNEAYNKKFDMFEKLFKKGFAEGGDVEPVAKKTMPLLDMDGQEMDLRAEGGFVPIGRMEKADDVPARLSKNEFVFTADAVRNAGEGDVDKGAEVMYNMMKNLESGGDVSEESQGLEGAREMFQTSQRLGEVI